METQAKEQLSDDTLPKGKLKAFLNDGSKNASAHVWENGGSDDSAVKNAKQIAELFPDTTIMFADIAGFTAWASSREPSHVFTLLETLYGAFDRQAMRMGEFAGCRWYKKRICGHFLFLHNVTLNPTFQVYSKLRPLETAMCLCVDCQNLTSIMH
jgi:hypothetical protein